MGEIAFVFSGQGDQYPGMGKDLAARYPSAARVFELCDRLRPGTALQCFEGAEEELKLTKNTQPCLFALELAAAEALRAKGVLPKAAAGFSLGEVTAAAFCGLLDHETGFRLVCRRGELMQSEAEQHDTSMAAVLKLTPEQVRELCSRYSEVYAVNFNCPGQIAVSGFSSQMTEFLAEVKAAGGRAVPLKVSGAFHSPLMKAASEAFARELEQVRFGKGSIPLYSDRTAELYGEETAKLLSEQICSPVLWEQLVRNMIRDGIDTFIEIGPGRTLTNMIKKIDPEVRAVTVYEFLSEAEACCREKRR